MVGSTRRWPPKREAGEIAGLEPRKGGKKPVVPHPLAAENGLPREVQRLEKRLHQAEAIIEAKKTVRRPRPDRSADREEREQRMIGCRELSLEEGTAAAFHCLDIRRLSRCLDVLGTLCFAEGGEIDIPKYVLLDRDSSAW